MSDTYSTYEDFEKWVDEYRDDLELPRLSRKSIKECYDILKKFHESWTQPMVNS